MILPECKYKGTQMDLATLDGRPDVGFEDHGIFNMNATFDYGSTCQGLGYCIDDRFIQKFIKAFGVSMLGECNGEIFIEHASGLGIARLIPLATHDGEEFDIAEFIKSDNFKLIKSEVK